MFTQHNRNTLATRRTRYRHGRSTLTARWNTFAHADTRRLLRKILSMHKISQRVPSVLKHVRHTFRTRSEHAQRAGSTLCARSDMLSTRCENIVAVIQNGRNSFTFIKAVRPSGITATIYKISTQNCAFSHILTMILEKLAPVTVIFLYI